MSLEDSLNQQAGPDDLFSDVSALAVELIDEALPVGHEGDIIHLTPGNPLDAPAGLLVRADDTLDGNGEIVGDALIEGTLSPGNSPGTIVVDGNLTLDADSVLVIEIGGRGAGEFDRVQVTGAAELGGSLGIQLIDGFVPSPGDVFEILEYGSANGTFAQIDGLDLGGGLQLVPVQRDGNFLLVTATEQVGAAALLPIIQGELQKYVDGINLSDISIQRESVDLGGFLQLFDLNLNFAGITVNGGPFRAGR